MRNDQDWASYADEGLGNTPAASLLVIRTWQNPGSPPSFRARITFGRAPEAQEQTIATSDPTEVLSVVRDWLAGRPGVAGRI